jgi:phosphoglycolate phosphatase
VAVTPHFGRVLFDFDGTLVDSLPWFLTVLNTVARRHNFRELDDAEADALRHLGSREILQRMQIPFWKLPSIARTMRALKAEAAGKLPLFAAVPDMLATFSGAGVTVGIVSSDSEANIRTTLAPHDAHVAMFDCSASMFGKAPKLRRAARAAQRQGQRTLFVGDEVRDVEAAREAGVPVAAVVWGYASRTALHAAAPDYMVETFDELIALVLPDRP